MNLILVVAIVIQFLASLIHIVQERGEDQTYTEEKTGYRS